MNNQDKRGGVHQPKGTPPNNGQPKPTEEQEAQMKRIEVASQNILAAMDGLTIMEATGALKTVESMLQKRMSEFMQTEKMGAPSADDSAKT